MEESEYRERLRKALDESSASAIDKISRCFGLLPEKTQEIDLMIFPDQDGEGTFSVKVSLSGPDLYVLNKAIREYSGIINVRHTANGLLPNVPLFDPFETDFEVNDVLSDVVGEWLDATLKKVNLDKVLIPISTSADEGYGATLPIKVQ